MKHAWCLVVLFLCGAVWPTGALAQVPEPPPDVFGAAGGSSSDGSLYLSGTLGQAVVGEMEGTNESLGGGFWHVTDRLNIGPTTAVLIASFDAVALDRGNELHWLIAGADGLEGFNIYRSIDSQTGYTRLNGGSLVPADEVSFIDPDVRPNQTYWYRLGAVDGDGEVFSIPRSVTTPNRDVELFQNYPNPFNPTTRIDFYLPADGRVALVVYDVQGRRVRTLLDEPTAYGHHSVTWDGTNDHGEHQSSGVYFYRLRVGSRAVTKKLIVVK